MVILNLPMSQPRYPAYQGYPGPHVSGYQGYPVSHVSGNQSYQGYPYVNPIVTDAPSIDAATASRWNDLPRRHVVPPVVIAGPSGMDSRDLDQHSCASKKEEIDENPVVYIDLPESTGSDVAQSIEDIENEPEFVQDTILYDPFENRRIDLPKDDSRSNYSIRSEESGSRASSPYIRPTPPAVLNLQGAGCSSHQSPEQSRLPAYLQKESQIYGGQDNEFILSPIDLTTYPDPPPAYTEVSTPVVSEPPRTQVIVTVPQAAATAEFTNPDRKYLTCHHCGNRGHTLVIREIGYVTHTVACIFLFIFLPIGILVYMTDHFKHLNHYCKNCNKLIGYEIPLFGNKVNYVK